MVSSRLTDADKNIKKLKANNRVNFMNRVLSFVICFILTMMSTTYSFGQPTTYLPVNHRAYDFLERMEHQFMVSGSKLATKPMTRSYVARLLIDVTNNESLLTEVDREELHCFLDEFKNDFPENKELELGDNGPVERMPRLLKNYVYKNFRNFCSARGENYSLYFDPVILRKASQKWVSLF